MGKMGQWWSLLRCGPSVFAGNAGYRLPLPASFLQACPLVSNPLKGSGNIEQRYRLPENSSALQTSSIGFICSK